MVLQEAIHQTFENRRTNIPSELPVAFSVQYAQEKQLQWTAFLKTAGIMNTPDQFTIIQNRIQEFLLPIFQSLRSEKKILLSVGIQAGNGNEQSKGKRAGSKSFFV